MCGILGYFAFGDERPAYEQLILGWQNMIERGDDGCGFVYKTTDDQNNPILKGVKSKLSSKAFCAHKNSAGPLAVLEGTEPKIAIFHTRKAAGRHWKKGTSTAHPFYNDKVAIVHNGIIRNDTDLEKKYRVSLDVDSAIIPHVFDTYMNADGVPDLRGIAQTLIGEFAIAAISKLRDELYILCNNERPVHIVYNEQDNILYFASEYKFLQPNFSFRYAEEKKFMGMTFNRWKHYSCEDVLIHYQVNSPTTFVIADTGIVQDTFKTQTTVPINHYTSCQTSRPSTTTPTTNPTTSIVKREEPPTAPLPPHSGLKNPAPVLVPKGLLTYIEDCGLSFSS